MGSWIDSALYSGGIPTAILLLMLVEGVVIVWFYRRTGAGIPGSRLLPSLFAGASLVLALKGAVTGSSVTEMGGWLTVALGAHVWDLVVRWEARPG